MEIGDLVWAKIRDHESSSSSYRPCLIEELADSHGVFVSFFDHQNPTYFPTYRLRPLADLADDRESARDELLDRALRWLYRRTALNLRCRCLAPPEAIAGDGEARVAFRAVAVAEFVRSKAVLPWVEVGDFGAAARLVAQVQAFRDYNAVGQRLVYRKKRRRSERGTCLADLQPCSNSGVEESFNMELDCGDQEEHNQSNKKMKVNPVIGVNPTILLLEGSDKSLCDEKFEQNGTNDTQSEEEEQSVYGMLLNLRFLALNLSSIGVNCLNNTVQRFLRYRELLFKKVSNVDFHKCSLKTREAYVSNYEHGIDDDRKRCEGQVCHSILPYVERPLRSVMKYEQSEERSFYELLVNLQCHGFDPSCLQANCLNAMEQAFSRFKSFRVDEVSKAYIRQCSPLKTREAYFSNPSYFKGRHRIEDGKKRCQSEVYGSRLPYSKTGVRSLGWKRQLDPSEVSISPFKFSKTIPIFSIDRAGYYPKMGRTEVVLSSSLLAYNDIDYSAERSGIALKLASIGVPLQFERQDSTAQVSTFACNGLLSDFSPNISDFSLCEESDYLSNIVDTICKDQDLMEMDTNVIHFEMSKRSFGVVNNNRMSYVYNFSESRNHGVHNAYTRNNLSYNSFQPSETESLCQKCDALEVIATDDRESQISAMSNGELNVASEDRTNKTKILNIVSPCTYGLSLNSSEAQESKVGSSFSGSKSLHLKFPRDKKLPSKEKLVKTFRRFGPIDSSKTEVFGCSGSAQVVFFKQLAAIAAFHYAKAKKLLPDQSNAHYQFDPFEDEKGRGKSVAGKTSVPGLKSCLRNPDARKAKVEKKPHNVKFLLETP